MSLGLETLAIGLCVEHGDDEEAIVRTVGVIAGVGLGAVSKYADDLADEVVDIADDVVESSKGIQLEEYLKEVESLFGKGWTTVLDTY